MTPRALIVDDERAECELLADALREAGFEPNWVQEPRKALDILGTRPFDVVVTDLNMPSMNGTELCRRIKETLPHLPVIVVTGFGSIDAAMDAIRAGAYDFVTKPFDVDAVGLVLRRAVEHSALKWEVDALRKVVDTSQRYGELIGTSDAIRRVYTFIDRVKGTDSTVLITGESGTGKELVAREIHRRGSRADGPFVTLSCATMPEALLDSALIGLERSGVLLLDEIGDMPIMLQARLSRALQERSIRPAGGTQEIASGARIIASTKRDLEVAVERGRFREDLYHRINDEGIELPPLRARAGDALLLAQMFLSESAVRNRRSLSGFTAGTADRLLAYDWPGNVREVRSCVERAVTLARSDHVEIEDLPSKIREYKPGHLIVVSDETSESVSLDEVERRYILKAVEACNGNKSRAARALGIGRKTLCRRLASFGVSVLEDEP